MSFTASRVQGRSVRCRMSSRFRQRAISSVELKASSWFLAAGESVRAAHPLAYVEDSGVVGGYQEEVTNILDAMATCELAEPSPSVVPSAAAAPPGTSPSPGRVIHTWMGREVVTLSGGPVVVSWSDEGCALTLEGN